MKNEKGQIRIMIILIIAAIFLSFVTAQEIHNTSSNSTLKTANSTTKDIRIHQITSNKTKINFSTKKILVLENDSKKIHFENYSNLSNESFLNKSQKLNSTPLTNESNLNFSEKTERENLSFENKTKKTKPFMNGNYYYLRSQENSQIKINPLEKNEQKNNSIETKNQSQEKKVKTTLSEDGEVQIEADLPESFNINNIKKTETQTNKKSKQVIVSSPIHVTGPLTVYSNIPEISKNKKNEIKIIWINKNQSISPRKFYDTNNDGKYDRISWIVPHLSTQIFEIKIAKEQNNSSNITISGPGEIWNTSTVFFNISSNQSNITCQFNIIGNKKNQSGTITFNGSDTLKVDLPNGNYTGNVLCFSENNSITETRNFTVKQEYSTILGGESIYIIDKNKKLIGNPNTNLTWSSSGNSFPDLYLHSLSSSGGSNLCTNENSCTNNSNNSFNLAPYLNSVGDYQFITDFSGVNKTKKFSIVQINLTSDKNKTETEKDINFKLNIKKTSLTNLNPIIGLDFGDGESTSFINKNLPITFKHSYKSKKNYTVIAYVTIDSQNLSNTYNITKKITITNPVNDTQKPKITMITPTEGETLNTSGPTFSYKVTDNIGIGNCSFYLYGPDNNGIENTPLTDKPSNNTQINHKFSKFSDGSYSWDVTCYDTNGNFADAIPTGARKFKISVNNTSYPHKDKIEKTSNALANFSKTKENLDIEKIDSLIDLGVMNNLTKIFPKQLNSIMQFFKTNQSSFITSNTQREKTIKNNIEELDYISTHIPQKIILTNKQKFVKNSISQNMAEIVKTYENYSGNVLKDNEIKNIALRNEPLQKYITTLTTSRDIEIIYPNSSKKITLITKKINISSNITYDAIFESFPKKINSKLFFLPSKTKSIEVKKISDNLYEIPKQYLQDNDEKLIYYFEKPVEQSTIKNTDTIIFKNMSPKKGIMTGFSVVKVQNGNQWKIIIVLFGILLIIYLGKKGKEKINLLKWRKEENVKKILKWVSVARKALKEDNDSELAKQAYHKIKSVFLLTPEGFRKYIRKEINRIQKGIDRREIIGFVKEYEKAKIQDRKEDAKRLYKEIKITYKRLPKEDQEKIYNKIFRKNLEI